MTTSLKTQAADEDMVLRSVGVVLSAGVGLVHFLDVFEKFEEAPYQGWMFIALILGCLVVGGLLVRANSRIAWGLAALCGAVPFVMYLLSRTVGLPGAADDIGNWMETLGLASLMIEACLVAVAGYAFSKGTA